MVLGTAGSRCRHARPSGGYKTGGAIVNPTERSPASSVIFQGALATERARTDDLTRALDVRLLWLETKAGAPVSPADRLIAETVYSRRIGLRTATDD